MIKEPNLIRTITKYGSNRYFLAEVSNILKIDMTEKLNDFWSVFKEALKKYPPKIGKLYSSRQASVYLSGGVSHSVLLKKSKEGVFNLIDGKFQQGELDEFKKLLDIKNMFLKTGVILETKDHNDDDIFAIIPTRIDKLGFSKLDQELKASAMLLKDPFVLAYTRILENTDQETLHIAQESRAEIDDADQRVKDYQNSKLTQTKPPNLF